jgi:hypothetical protein
MLWSKIWFFLVAVAAAVILALLLFQPRPMQAELDAQVEARLGGAERGAAMLLKIHARRWLDETSHIASDAQLVEALDQSSRSVDLKVSGIDLVHKSAQARLRSFNGDLKTDAIIAVDARGRVLARTGLEEAVWRDEIAGYPVVAEALRGYRLDDTWDTGEKLYRVTAAPVVARDRYVGCLVVLQEIGADLATRIHDAQGVEVAFLVGGKVVSQSSSLPILGDLPPLVKAHAADLGDKGHTDSIPVKGGDRSYVVTLAALPGEAAAHDASYALIAERPLATSVSSTLGALSLSMFTGKEIALVGGGLFGALLIGLLLMSLEHDRPTRRLLGSLQELSRGESSRVDDLKHGGKFGGMARAVNATLDRRAQAPGQGRERSIDSILGPAPQVTPIPPRLPDAMPPPIPKPTDAPGFHPDTPLSAAPVPPEPPITTPTPLQEIRAAAAAANILPQLHSIDAPDSKSDNSITQPAAAAKGLDLANAQPFGVEPPTKPHGRPLATLSDNSAADQFDAPPTVMESNVLAAGSLGSEGGDDSTTISHPNPQLLAALKGGSETLEAEFKAVFREFLDTKRKCGEPIDGVSYEKFVVKLQQNRDQLMTRYACKGVKFQVYVKDGKAALKATPISR